MNGLFDPSDLYAGKIPKPAQLRLKFFRSKSVVDFHGNKDNTKYKPLGRINVTRQETERLNTAPYSGCTYSIQDTRAPVRMPP